MIDLLEELSENVKKNTRFPDDQGIMGGVTGMALLCFILSKQLNDPDLENKAFDLLDTVSENIGSIKETNFSRGLLGVGWAIQWLAENRYIEADTDEILADIDDVIYKATMFSPDTSLSLHHGTLGKLFYFFSRIRSINTAKNRFKNIIHETCLIMLSNELRDKLITEKGLLQKSEQEFSTFDLLDMGHTLLFSSAFLHFKINEAVVETILYETVKKTSEILKYKPQYLSAQETLYRKFLSICYYLAGQNHGHRFWQEQALETLSDQIHSDFTLSLTGITDANASLIIQSILYQVFPNTDQRTPFDQLTANLFKEQSITFQHLYNMISILFIKQQKFDPNIVTLQLFLL